MKEFFMIINNQMMLIKNNDVQILKNLMRIQHQT